MHVCTCIYICKSLPVFECRHSAALMDMPHAQKGWGAENCRCDVPFLGFVADENLQNMKPAAVNSSKDAQHVGCEAGGLPCAFFARAPVSSEDSCAWTQEPCSIAQLRWSVAQLI